MTVVHEQVQLAGTPGGLCSLLPLGGPAVGVLTDGLRFPLRRETLAPGTTRGVSNEFLGTSATVSLDDGVLLAVVPATRKGRLMRRCSSRSPLLFIVAVAATSGTPVSRLPRRRRTITLVTHDSFAVSKTVLAAFTKRTGITVKVLQAGDAGAALNQAILTKDNPIGDVFFGVDNTFLVARARRGHLRAVRAPALADVPDEFQLDAAHRLTPIDHGDVCINYDKQWFAEQEARVPTTLDDLDQARVQGPARGREPGDVVARARVPARHDRRATATTAGATTGRKLRANDVKVVDGWEQAYDGDFTAGRRPGHVPARRVVRVEPAGRGRVLLEAAAEDVADRHHARLVLPPGRVRRRAQGHRARGRGAQARRLHALASSSRPTCRCRCSCSRSRDGTPLPDGVHEVRRGAGEPALAPARRHQPHRDAWIEQWTDTVLR